MAETGPGELPAGALAAKVGFLEHREPPPRMLQGSGGLRSLLCPEDGLPAEPQQKELPAWPWVIVAAEGWKPLTLQRGAAVQKGFKKR